VPRVSKRALSEAGRLLVQGAINIGAAGGKARAKALSKEERSRIARMGGLARQKKASKKRKAA
jgi:hypothetical protein